MRSSIYKLHPATLFFLLTLLVAVTVWLLDVYGVEVYNSSSNGYLQVQSLFNAEGIRWLLRNFIKNFSSFAPLGMVVVSLLGLGIAEHSGFISAMCREIPIGRYTRPLGLLAFIFFGILSNVLGDSGYVFLLPLVMLVAPRLGINPLYALITTFSAVACGYSANIVVSSMDPLLARIASETTVNLQPQNFSTGTYSNYYFMFCSSLLLLVIIFFVAERFLKPRLERLSVTSTELKKGVSSQRERRAFQLAVVVGGVFLATILWLNFSSIALFRGVSGEIVRSPFIMGALLILSLTIGLMGLVYGLFLGVYRSDRDVVGGFVYFIKEFSYFFVIAFFAAQFFSCLAYTRLDQFLVLYLGNMLASWELPAVGLLGLFILYSAVSNLFMVSAVSKWTLIAPLFIPLFWSMQIAPDEVQVAYRLGESATNVVTPFLYYCPFVLVLMNRYVKRISFSFLLKTTWLFSVAILIGWTLFFFIWHFCGLPYGL